MEKSIWEKRKDIESSAVDFRERILLEVELKGAHQTLRRGGERDKMQAPSAQDLGKKE